MRQLLSTILQLLVDAEATAVIGAEPHQRTDTRVNQRNGTRDKLVSTATGDLTVKIPKLRHGSFFPSLLQPRRRIDIALHAAVMQAWIEGVSTRKVDDLVAALGVESGISKSEVSRICSQLDVEVDAWRTRSLADQPTPYVFLDATYCKSRVKGWLVSRAVGIVRMYHDQGQIAIKLLGFDGGVTVQGGLPVIVATPAHGTAFDIAGQGIASVTSTQNALDVAIAVAGRQRARDGRR